MTPVGALPAPRGVGVHILRGEFCRAVGQGGRLLRFAECRHRIVRRHRNGKVEASHRFRQSGARTLTDSPSSGGDEIARDGDLAAGGRDRRVERSARTSYPLCRIPGGAEGAVQGGIRFGQAGQPRHRIPGGMCVFCSHRGACCSDRRSESSGGRGCGGVGHRPRRSKVLAGIGEHRVDLGGRRIEVLPGALDCREQLRGLTERRTRGPNRDGGAGGIAE